jgi:hypothetical protein
MDILIQIQGMTKTSSAPQPVPLCSVLNTIVDHVMVPPTPNGTTGISRGLAGQQQRQEKELNRDLDSSPQLPTQKTTTATTNGFAGTSYHECWTRSTSGDDDEAYR